jgi:hypothetical protein
LAVIFLHECLHAMHHVHQLTDETPLRRAHALQTDALATFIRMNPGAWSWWFGILLQGASKTGARPALGVQPAAGGYHTPGPVHFPLAR